MSLARAFTTRRGTKRSEISAPLPQRSLTTKQSFTTGDIRNKISGPVELISTTNMLSYNAPDIHPSSSNSSLNSGEDSDMSPSRTSSPPTSPDSSSISSRPTSPEVNHLSCYFGTSSRQSASGDEGAPKIPQRAPSRKRSTRLSSKPSMSTVRSSINMFSPIPDTPEEHPFGNELAQVSELAEEYGISKEKMTVIDEEERELAAMGLIKFRAEEYMNEIHGLFLSAFSDSKPPMSTMWI